MPNKRHTIDYYMDGFKVIAFCEVCSAEGDKLLENCPQETEAPKKYIDPQKIIRDLRN